MKSAKSITDIVKEWKDEAQIPDYKETIAIHLCTDNTLFIITRYPGYFIGKSGRLFDKYHDMMKDNGFNLKIKFVDVFCGGLKSF